ncbi:MAG TPA: HEAT repeat domain-containing protein [Kofleriaceae bacterium]
MIAATLALAGSPVFADRIDDLSKQLASSSSDKARLEAVAALSHSGDKRALKPLVTALHDPATQVRAVAATALGKLGHKAALPALHEASKDDADPVVRVRARDAMRAVAKANNLAVPTDPGEAAETAGPRVTTRHGGTAGFGHDAHAVAADHPELYVLINSSADDSPGVADKAMRKTHAEFLKQTLADSLRSSPTVTTVAADAQKWGLDARHIDLSVTKLEVEQDGSYMAVDAQLRLAISDDNGKMLSFVSGGAKVQVPKRTFDAKYLPMLRKEALENAMRGMFDKLIGHLRERAAS